MAALCGCDGVVFEPDRQIAAFEAEANGGEALLVLSRLAEQHGLELKGGFFVPPAKAAAPPVDEATIRAGDCLLMAKMRGSVLELSLRARDKTTCPPEIHNIFEQTRRRLTPESMHGPATS